MTNVYRALTWIAGCGLVLSIIAHGMSLAGLVPSGDKIMSALNIWIIIIWLATIYILRSISYARREDVWKGAFAGCPPWMRRGFYILCGYTVLNFVFVLATTAGERKQSPGDEAPSLVRQYSGFWMVFYAAACCTLYSRVRAPHLYMDRICPQGHTAAPAARFCSECGHQFSATHTNE